MIARTGVSPAEDAALISAVQKKFPDVSPQLNHIPVEPGQWGIRLYAMIRKSMPFESPFDRFRVPLEFSSGSEIVRVNSFGQDPQNSTDIDPKFGASQIQVLDDLGDHDFIVQMNSIGGQQDEMILGLVPAETSLAATWESVQRRIQQPNPLHSRPELDGNETLQVPILDFSIQHRFSELENQPVAGFKDPATLELAFVDIRLRLDETGAEFLSMAEVGVRKKGDAAHCLDPCKRSCLSPLDNELRPLLPFCFLVFSKKVALTAAMRKLLTILNTLIRTDQLWIDPALCSKETAS